MSKGNHHQGQRSSRKNWKQTKRYRDSLLRKELHRNRQGRKKIKKMPPRQRGS